MSALKKALAIAAIPATMAAAPAGATEPVQIFNSATDYGVDLQPMDESYSLGYFYNPFFDITRFRDLAIAFSTSDLADNTKAGLLTIQGAMGEANVSLWEVTLGIGTDVWGETIETMSMVRSSSVVSILDGVADFSSANFVLEDYHTYAIMISPNFQPGQETGEIIIPAWGQSGDIDPSTSPIISSPSAPYVESTGSSQLNGIYMGENLVTVTQDRGIYRGDLTYQFVLNAAAVPEPKDYAMFLAGLGLVGVAARKWTVSVGI